jgi:hypothetical protein
MADERTPADLRREVLRARREREEAIRKELEAPPDWEDTEEPSKVTIVGPAAEAFVARGGLIERAKHSLAPISERMSSPRGKLAALITLVVSAVVAAVLKELMGQ